MDRQVVAQFRNEIAAAAGGLGLQLTYNRLRGLVIRAIREGRVDGAVRQLRLEARYPRTASTLARGIGIGRPVRDPVEPKRLDFDSATDMMVDKTSGVVKDPNQGYSQLTKRSFSHGVALKGDAKKLKLLGSKMLSQIQRWNNVSPSAKTGRYILDYVDVYPDPTGAQGQTEVTLPVYLMDLTCHYNDATIDGQFVAGAQPQPFRRLFRTKGSNGAFYTTVQSARNREDAASVTTWQDEVVPHSGVRKAGEKLMIDWFDIRLLLYGASGRPSRIHVSLVQFNDPQLCPSASYEGVLNATEPEPDGAAREQQRFAEWQDMWLAHTDSLVGNPITKRGSKNAQKQITYLWTRTFDFQPIDLQEADQSGHQIDVSFRYNHYKVHDYVRMPRSGTEVSAEEMGNPNEWDLQGSGKTSGFCDGRGRVYLMITGETMENAFGGWTPAPPYTMEPYKGYAVAPQFDLVVRRKTTELHS